MTDHRRTRYLNSLGRAADPLLFAMVGHELCLRAGIPSRVCVTEDGAWVGLVGVGEFSLVGALPFDEDPGDLRLACAHECACLLLGRLRLLAHDDLAYDCPGHRVVSQASSSSASNRA